MRLILALLPLGLLGCRSHVAYPERMYNEVLELFASHEGTGGLRRDVRDSMERRWATVARWADEGLLATPTDKLWAALTLTLSDHEEHLVLAESLALEAADAGETRANLAYAHAQDCLALHRGEATQPWGTEYRYNHVLGRYELYPPPDPRTSDAEREAMGIPPLSELRAGIAELNHDPATEALRARIQAPGQAAKE